VDCNFFIRNTISIWRLFIHLQRRVRLDPLTHLVPEPREITDNDGQTAEKVCHRQTSTRLNLCRHGRENLNRLKTNPTTADALKIRCGAEVRITLFACPRTHRKSELFERSVERRPYRADIGTKTNYIAMGGTDSTWLF